MKSAASPPNARFLAVAQDSRIIPGVHHHCDDWCDYCPVTTRCLAYRCTAEFRKEQARADDEPTFRSLDEAVAFTRALAEIEGLETAELDVLVSRGAAAAGLQTSDPLAGVARAYAVRVATGFAPIASMVACAPVRPEGPDPIEVLLWHHVRIYLRLVRALVAREGKAPGLNRMEDAIGSAKLVLVAIQKSRQAVHTLQTRDPGEATDGLLSMLDAFERGIDERFPEARGYIRVGLDVPAA